MVHRLGTHAYISRVLAGLVSLLLVSGLIFAPFGFVASEAEAAPSSDELSVVLVIDSSGSMAENDATDLRLNAAKIFVDLLSPNDRVGVIDFDTDVKLLVPVRPVGTTTERGNIKDTIDTIDADGGTDIGGALEAAYKELARVQAPTGRGMVVLLTDGEPDVPRLEQDDNLQRYMENLNTFVAAFGQQGWPVHTVALSDQADTELLQQIAHDTRGGFYAAQQASQLATTFTGIVWSLKNQMMLVHEQLKFEGETTEAKYNVDFDRYTQQVTLLAVSAGAATFDLNVYNPQNQALFHFQSAFKENNYTLLTIPSPTPGQWRVELNGSGQIELFVTADKTVKVWLEDPLPNSKLAMGKNIQLAGTVWQDGQPVAGDDWKLQAEVTKPGNPPEIVDLDPMQAAAAGAVQFTGGYAGTNVLGDYTVTLRALEGDTAVAWQTFHLYVEDLPLVQANLWHDEEDFRVGDRMALDATLLAGSVKLNPADATQELEVDELQAVVHPVGESDSDRSQVYTLFDDGSKSHSDAAAGDGSFGNMIELTETGDWVVEVRVMGRYKGQAFQDHKLLQPMMVLAPATISVKVLGTNDSNTIDWFTPGNRRMVTVSLASDSTRTEDVYLQPSGDGPGLQFSQEKFTLQPGEKKEVRLQLTVPDSVTPGTYPVDFQLATSGAGIILEPSEVQFAAQVRSEMDYFRHRWGVPLVAIAGVAGAFVLIVIAGNFAFGLVRLRQRRIQASLIYWPKDGDRELSGRRLKLRSGLKDHVRVASESERKGADYVLPEIERPFSFVIRATAPEVQGARFVQGFRSLVGRREGGLEVQGEGRTRMSYGGLIRVSARLYNGDTFEVGAYVFEFIDEKRADGDRANLDLIPEHVAAQSDGQPA